MRVGFLTYALDRPLTGIGRYTVEMLKALQQHEAAPAITLLTSGGAGEFTTLPIDPLSGCRLLPALVTAGNVHTRIKSHRYDILHDTSGVTPFAFGVARGARTVVTLYDVIPLSFPGVSTRLDTLIYQHWLPRVVPRVDAVITISEASKADIVRYLRVPESRVHVVYAGVSAMYRPMDAGSIAAVKARYELPEQYILFIGSVEARKNLRRVIQAFDRLRDLPHKLVITGPQKWHYAEILSDAHHLRDRVLFTGYVEQAHLPALYSGADLFVYPSLYEGFGLPVIEAMACGTPVITSNVASLPEAAGDAGVTVNPYDVDALEAALRRVLTQPDFADILRQKGIAHASRFSWHNVADAHIKVYERL